MSTGDIRWSVGQGVIGFTDDESRGRLASFSESITGIAIQPICSIQNILADSCPAPTRPNFFTGGNRWMFVADSGNCAVRMVSIFCVLVYVYA